jgi:predicted acyltransferase
MTTTWLLRMARWLRHPPSPQRVKLVLAVIGICLVIFGIEAIWGWPDALTPERIRPQP